MALENLTVIRRQLSDTLESLQATLEAMQQCDREKSGKSTAKTNAFYTPEEIAKSINVSPQTIRRWCRNGEIRYFKFGRNLRVAASDWIDFCKKNALN